MKFLKKHFTKFLMSFTLVFTCLFVAFGCNTYAFTIDSNGNLVSDNLMDCENYINAPSGNSWQILGIAIIDDYNAQYTISFNYNQSISGNGGLFLVQNSEPTIPNSIDYPNLGNKLLSSYEYGYVSNNLIYVEQTNFQNTISMPYIMLAYRSRNNKTFNLNNVMFNVGNSALSWEPYGTWYSQENYSQLQDNYSDLQGQYINLKNRYNYGFFADLSNFRMVASNNGVQVIDDSYNLQDLIYQNLFSNGTFLLDNFIISNNNITYTNASIKIDFAPNLVASNVDLIFVGSYAFNFPFTITLANNQSINFNITNEDNIINHNILNDFSASNGNSPISNFKIFFDYNQFIPNIVFNSDYSNAYNTGFSDGQNASYTTINQLDKQINDLNSQIANMSNTISTLQVAYNDLNTSYQNMLSGNNFANLFFTIAETPFASFKQIWNVDFLGVNLAGFVTGILFLGLVIWVIKKIF